MWYAIVEINEQKCICINIVKKKIFENLTMSKKDCLRWCGVPFYQQLNIRQQDGFLRYRMRKTGVHPANERGQDSFLTLTAVLEMV
jgi:hypothetical protein